jgi:hypothetical protein
MNATSVRPVLYALTVSLLANGSGYAAGIRALGGETGPGKDTVQKSQSALAGGSARRDEFGQDGPIRTGDTTTHGSKSRTPSARNGLPPAVLHGAGLAPKRGVNALLGARSELAKPAVAAARGYLPRGPAADHRAGLPDPGTAPARVIGATSGSAPAGRPSSSVLLAAGRPPATLKPLAANGVIGGPRAAGLGRLGGPANSKTVINGSIDGSAPRRRF